jgi:UDP-4-amino-4,6-dideoxy-N-acetyl-beta-L-altrosamine N-acetyltransferase
VIGLRLVDATDKGMILRWRNLPEVAPYMYSDHVITSEEHDRWFACALDDPASWYRIITLDSEPVGLVSMTKIDAEARRCSWAFYLAAASVRGRGVGSWVEYHVIQTAFGEMELEKLCCEVLTMNDAVVAMHESFGFRREGYLRQHIRRQGQAHDVVVLALLRSEWEVLQPSVEHRLSVKGIIGVGS